MEIACLVPLIFSGLLLKVGIREDEEGSVGMGIEVEPGVEREREIAGMKEEEAGREDEVGSNPLWKSRI